MSIFINDASKVIVQGMTGSEGTKHTRRMLASGTKVVGGVTPGKGGQVVDIDGHQLPVFNTVAEAMSVTGANVSVVFVPPKFAKAAVIDAVANGIVAALETLGATATKPIVVRLDGNNVEEGRAILNAANHPLVEQLDTMDGAASRAAELAAK